MPAPLFLQDLRKLGRLFIQKSSAGISVLLYHAIDHNPVPGTITPEVFEKQLCYLKNKARIISYEQALKELREKSIMSPAVVLSFDDGTADFVVSALPLLEKYQLPATVFLTPHFLGSVMPSPSHHFSYKLMSWAAAAKLAQHPLITVGSHGLTHQRLINLSESELEQEVKESKTILEQKLNIPIRHFSFPKGNFDEASLKAVKEAGYESALSCIEQRLKGGENIYTLGRFWVNKQTRLRDLYWILKGVYQPEKARDEDL